jgi:carboxyl-terminal processing protease
MKVKSSSKVLGKIFLFIVPLLILWGFVLYSPQETLKLPADINFKESVSDTVKFLQPKPEHYKEALLISAILKQYHYKKTPLNDSLSSLMFDNYLSTLDNNRHYFLKSDIEVLEEYRFQLDDDLAEGNLGIPFTIFEIFRRRFNERNEYVVASLDKDTPLDFSIDEYLDIDRENADWPADGEALDELWRKNVKNQALNHKLRGSEWPEIVEKLNTRYEQYQKTIDRYKSEDVFQLFMNSFLNAYDPHTSYFSPKSAEDFKIDMSRSLEGIGARLGEDGDYVVVRDIIAGGPVFKDKQIKLNDRIVGVAQDTDTAFVDLIGWRVEDAVTLIRGPKGSIVRLQILAAEAAEGSTPTIVALERDKIKLEDQSAQKEILNFHDGNRDLKLGVIKLPAFYMDFEAAQKGDPDFKSTSRDVKLLLEELKAEQVDGVMIDLRFNGGGSLEEAIQLTGLFIEKGPVVQVKRSNGDLDIGTDDDQEITYNGPLAVLVNRFSASASEIFAGAIQDYKRGAIIGEQTYGKGTVQQVIGLDNFLRNESVKLGQLKLTLAKYYRITGSSTQHLGVTPDVNLPSAFDASEYGESSQPSALPWDQINGTEFIATNMLDKKMVASLNSSFRNRLKNDPILKDLSSSIDLLKEKQQVNKVSLNEAMRKKELEEAEKRRNAETTAPKGGIKLSKDGINDKNSPEILKDPYLREGATILSELISSGS